MSSEQYEEVNARIETNKSQPNSDKEDDDDYGNEVLIEEEVGGFYEENSDNDQPKKFKVRPLTDS